VDDSNKPNPDADPVLSGVKSPGDVTPDSTSRPIIQNQPVGGDPMVTTGSSGSSVGSDDPTVSPAPDSTVPNLASPESPTPPIAAPVENPLNSVTPAQPPATSSPQPDLNAPISGQTPAAPKSNDSQSKMLKKAVIVVAVLIVLTIVLVLVKHH
jgi:hypothetical protein